jgi:Kef-type K+ transport system membrane component KefB
MDPDSTLAHHDILGQGTAYVLLIIGLFIVPQALERWRIPTAITSLGLGAGLGMGFGMFQDDQSIHLLSTFGIVSLFLFAGLEVDIRLISAERKTIASHIAMRLIGLAGVTWMAHNVFALDFRPSALLGLAILTPSTGFILSSLRGFGLDLKQERTVKSHAIASEIVALLVLFVVLRSGDSTSLLVGILSLAGMVIVVPLIFRWMRTWLVDHGPRGEFAFLVVLAIACASITKALGAYYLLGAFMAGLIAQRTRLRDPTLVSKRMVESVELFAVFFIPFYFLAAGLEFRKSDFSLKAVLTGLLIFVVVRPLWLLIVATLRRRQHGETLNQGMRVAWALMPTLVFTLVIAQILRDGFGLSSELFGGLIIYALCTTLLPLIALRLPANLLDFTAPEALDLTATGSDTMPGSEDYAGINHAGRRLSLRHRHINRPATTSADPQGPNAESMPPTERRP